MYLYAVSTLLEILGRYGKDNVTKGIVSTLLEILGLVYSVLVGF